METKKAKVIMLPTEDKISPILQGVVYNDHLVTLESVKKDKEWLTFGKPQHLYITTDDEIKKEDWVYIPHLKHVIQNKHGEIGSVVGDSIYLNKNCFKIIATTDKSLLEEHDDTVPYLKMRRTNIAQIPQAFIEKYCKAGGIDEVLVEYYTNTASYGNILLHQLNDDDSWFGTLGLEHGVEISKSKQELINLNAVFEKEKLKVDQNNCITIHPIKEKMYSREEVIDILDDFNSRGGFGDSFRNGEEFDNWIKEKLTTQ